MGKQLGRILSLAGVAALAVLVGATRASADERVTAKVPFAFIVADTKLPAGSYEVTSSSNDPDVISISSADGEHHAIVLTIAAPAADASAQARLVFQKFSGEYFLSSIVAPGETGREVVLTPAKMEREIVEANDGE